MTEKKSIELKKFSFKLLISLVFAWSFILFLLRFLIHEFYWWLIVIIVIGGLVFYAFTPYREKQLKIRLEDEKRKQNEEQLRLDKEKQAEAKEREANERRKKAYLSKLRARARKKAKRAIESAEKYDKYKGLIMKCNTCGFKWTVKKSVGAPARCHKCNSEKIEPDFPAIQYQYYKEMHNPWNYL